MSRINMFVCMYIHIHKYIYIYAHVYVSRALTQRSKAPEHEVCRGSTVGIIVLVLGRYLLFVYLDPWVGGASEPFHSTASQTTCPELLDHKPPPSPRALGRQGSHCLHGSRSRGLSMAPRGSKYPVLKDSGLKSHTLGGF